MRRNLTPEVCSNAVAKLATLALCFTAWCYGAFAAQANGTIPLTVRIYNYAGVPAGVLSHAEKETDRVFAQTGIQLSWASCAVSDRDFANAPASFVACSRASDAPIIKIQSQPNGARRAGPVAGVALEDRVAIWYNQVREISADHGISSDVLLGHVMAHELGHVLLGDNSHSSEGIMIAAFRDKELRRAQKGTLLFTAQQGARVRAKLR